MKFKLKIWIFSNIFIYYLIFLNQANCARLNTACKHNKSSNSSKIIKSIKKQRQTPLSVLVDQLLKPNCLNPDNNIVNPLPPISINYPNLNLNHPLVQNYPHLYCYSCNGNQLACRTPVDIKKIKDHLVPCNGQCMQYRNPYDNFITYRGCSWDMGFMQKQPPAVQYKGITYYFCSTYGCNIL